MKNIITTVIVFIAFTTTVYCQENRLEFNREYHHCENKWVAFPAKDGKSYMYGMIYIDQSAGFTYDHAGTFTIDANGLYIADPKTEDRSLKYRITGGFTKVAVIPDTKLSDLKLPEFPSWLSIYREGENETEAQVKRGFIFNDVGASDLALKPLLAAYKKDPHFKGLEFELSFAYNALKQYKDAEIVLNKAISHAPKDAMFYRELGYTYKNQNKTEKSEEAYTKGIKISSDKSQQAEMAFNMAGAYYELKNKPKFDQWKKVYDKYAGTNAFMDKNILEMEVELKKI